VAHEFAFADVAVPRQHFCLTLPLRDYSIGHRILFMRQRNPLVFGDESEFNKLPSDGEAGQKFWLIRSVAVCNQTFAYRIQLEREPTKEILKAEEKTGKDWMAARAKSQDEFLAAARADTSRIPDLNEWWALELAQFRNYINSSRIVTDFKFKREPFPFLPCEPMPDATKGRALGGPYESTLIQFLLNARFVQDMAAAMEYSFALAEMHYLTHLEREGAIRILNAQEIEFKETCAARDLEAARAAGFDTVEEHIEFVKGNAKKENEKRAAATEARNLASEVPAELKGTP
jgi:hypothetical protein